MQSLAPLSALTACLLGGGGLLPARTATELRGGYDATVGADPSTPIQFFTLPGNTCPYAQRTHITLKELGLPFDITEVSGMPKPDWYLKINPRGKVPASRKGRSFANTLASRRLQWEKKSLPSGHV